MNNEIAGKLKDHLKENFIGTVAPREGRLTIEVSNEGVLQAAEYLCREYDARLVTISATDLGLDIQLLYHFSIPKLLINLKTIVPKEDLRIVSLTPSIFGANWIEREIHDLFGVEFEGHPDPRRLILSYEWPRDNTPLKGLRKGLASDFQKPTMENLLSTGQIFPMSLMAKRQRVKMKIPEVLPTTIANPEALDELQKVVKGVGFDGRVGYDWKTKKMRY
jgi:NADH-quinone oxidoreductase subunit C